MFFSTKSCRQKLTDAVEAHSFKKKVKASLDVDGDYIVSLDEFTERCMQLHGPARSVDLHFGHDEVSDGSFPTSAWRGLANDYCVPLQLIVLIFLARMPVYSMVTRIEKLTAVNMNSFVLFML